MSLLRILWLFLALFTVDQLTKLLVQFSMHLGDSIPVIPGLFHITYVLNPGAAFGMLAYQTTFFILITLGVLGVIGYVYWKVGPERELLRVSLALQVAGALGNLIDRIRVGRVIDFFDFRIWPVFNVADILIFLGVLLLIYEAVKKEESHIELW